MWLPKELEEAGVPHLAQIRVLLTDRSDEPAVPLPHIVAVAQDQGETVELKALKSVQNHSKNFRLYRVKLNHHELHVFVEGSLLDVLFKLLDCDFSIRNFIYDVCQVVFSCGLVVTLDVIIHFLLEERDVVDDFLYDNVFSVHIPRAVNH